MHFSSAHLLTDYESVSQEAVAQFEGFISGRLFQGTTLGFEGRLKVADHGHVWPVLCQALYLAHRTARQLLCSLLSKQH